MMKLVKWVVVIIVFGFPCVVQAEFYKYVDKDGNVQFTDNLANVPADQRKQVDEYEEVVRPRKIQEPVEADEEQDDVGREAVGPEDIGKKEGQGQEDEAEAGEKDTAASTNEQSVGEQQLRETQEQLRVEYEALKKERAAIEQMASRRLSPKLKRRLQEDTASFNQRIKDFEKRKEAHNKAVEAHNARLGQAAQPSSEGQPAD